VPKDTLVDIEIQGSRNKQNIYRGNAKSDEYYWNYRGQAKHGDIIAYRLSEEKCSSSQERRLKVRRWSDRCVPNL